MWSMCIHVHVHVPVVPNEIIYTVVTSLLYVLGQVAEYNKLKTKAGKKAAALNQQLERVSTYKKVLYMYIHVHVLLKLHVAMYTYM